VYPDGGEIHTVETSAANADAFSSRAEWCDKALVRRATGGLLTVLAESGSGTLAGSAHMEAFRQIAANDAISIAECINRQYVRRRIAAEFPGEPVLVYFTLTQPMINDRAATVNMLCQLAGQRWRATDEAVSEEVGVEVHTEEVQSTNYEVRSENSAPAVQVPVMNAGAMPDKPNREEEPPLTEDELAALRALGGELTPAQIAADADYMTREMMAGLEEPDEENESEGDVVANFGTSAGAYKGWENRKGANMRKQKGGSGSKGNPKNPTTKSNTPLKAAPGAKVQAQVDATEHALKSREAGGGVVKGAAWVKGKRIDVKGGSKATGGAAHMKNHYKPGDTSRREAAKDINLGRKQKDRTEVASVGKKNKVILADKGDHLEPVTTRRKKDND